MKAYIIFDPNTYSHEIVAITLCEETAIAYCANKELEYQELEYQEIELTDSVTVFE